MAYAIAFFPPKKQNDAENDYTLFLGELLLVQAKMPVYYYGFYMCSLYLIFAGLM
jgi:hypothetical protein